MRNFKQLKIWQKGLEIAIQTFKLVSTFPREERFGLTSQITKAGVSIPSNIAEGSSRSSEKEYSRFVEISLGSAYELETQILIAEAVNFGEHSVRDNLLCNIMEEQRMLVTFISRLNK
jgi:four helix bundle protein